MSNSRQIRKDHQPYLELKGFLKHKNPGFLCCPAGGSDGTHFRASVYHRLGRPASKKELVGLEVSLGYASEQIVELYCLWNGMILFCDSKSDAAGIELFPISEFSSRSAEMRSSMEAFGFDPDRLPSWVQTGVAIGQVPDSGNFLVIGTEKETAGSVFYADHEGVGAEPIAKNLKSMFDLLLKEPAQFLMELGCFTRYADGATNKQWIPQEYWITL